MHREWARVIFACFWMCELAHSRWEWHMVSRDGRVKQCDHRSQPNSTNGVPRNNDVHQQMATPKGIRAQ